jgi:prepilin-type N-terminal cleavage/methylation domain-containing protein
MKKLLNQAGDTIIEVLLAVTILGVVVSATYAVSNRASRIGQTAQERSEAVRLGEQQLEMVRIIHKLDAYRTVRNALRGSSGSQQCLHYVSGSIELTSGAGQWTANCETFAGTRYAIELEYVNNDLFRTFVRWEGIGSDNDQVVNLISRVR